MERRTVELLAPAGNFACFRAAINAGADAVYLGGEKFGARAYADNFSCEEIIQAIHIAHIFDRKIYLTVNTLVKESEFSELVPYMKPFYKAGLDGVIVQDLGVLEEFRQQFPDLALHASTQMTITGKYGAAYMKKLGVCRVVPARELSLEEIRDMKDATGLEIECFIHGAMCYAYSGQCLFSSILGGRSGNRGRCAGPCRLPYTDEKGNTLYPLSLKDMYTLSILPKLIDAGIDSFKIEGRMKSPEYVAGVTAVYRKYIDLYLENPNDPYQVTPSDEQLLKELYIRSDICNGYYQKHNDKEMVTLKEPGYSGSSQTVLDRIREKYIAKNIQRTVTGYIRIYAGEQAMFTLSCGNLSVTAMGDVANTAINKPLEETDLTKRFCKMGDTCFVLADLVVDTDNASFMTVKSLNELRRSACAKLEEELTKCDRTCDKAFMNNCSKRNILMPNISHTKHTEIEQEVQSANSLCILVSTMEQLKVIHNFPQIKNIYINADIFLLEKNFVNEKNFLCDRDYFLVLPHIFRKRSYKYMAEYKKLLDSNCFKGVLVRNFEEIEWLWEIGYRGKVISDYTIYAWNNAALAVCAKQFDRITLPLELNRRELNTLYTSTGLEFVVYGYIPLMYSANCIRNTLEKCKRDTVYEQSAYHLIDRYKNVFPVVCNCLHCYNILYNTVPLSLHGHMDSIAKMNGIIVRLDFSIESAEQAQKVIAYYLNKNNELPFQDFTNGHYKRGAE